MTLFLLLFLFFIVAPIGMIIHEFGHAIGAIITKADRVILTIGLGNCMLTFNIKHINVKVHALYFLGGYTKTERRLAYTKTDVFWTTLFGPLNNGLFSLAFYCLYVVFLNPYIKLLFLFNLWLAVVNLIPFKYKGKQSDGYILLNTIRKKIMVKLIHK